MNAHELINGPLRDFASPNVFNPWRDADELQDLQPSMAAQWRRWRLEQHFDCAPKYLLIGEAPGYQGCHFSGVPFTSERLLLNHGSVPRIHVDSAITRKVTPYSEPSATIVWGALHRLGIADQVVMWNAFAWHPHEPGNLLSNRKPKRTEIEAGWNVLRHVLTMFADARMIAIGGVASATLIRLGVKVFGVVRHPAYGGANDFRAQLAVLCGREAVA